MLVIFFGKVSTIDLEEHVTRVLRPEYNQPGKMSLVVLTEDISTSEISYSGLVQAGKRMHKAEYRNGGKLAIITHSTVDFGLAKIYQMVSEVAGLDETHVLRGNQLDTAIEWLGLMSESDEIKSIINQVSADDG